MTDATFEPFVRNTWSLAAWPEELAEGMLSRTIMNELLVLFHDAILARKAIRRLIEAEQPQMALAGD